MLPINPWLLALLLYWVCGGVAGGMRLFNNEGNITLNKLGTTLLMAVFCGLFWLLFVIFDVYGERTIIRKG